jgi:hypothetical protein
MQKLHGTLRKRRQTSRALIHSEGTGRRFAGRVQHDAGGAAFRLLGDARVEVGGHTDRQAAGGDDVAGVVLEDRIEARPPLAVAEPGGDGRRPEAGLRLVDRGTDPALLLDQPLDAGQPSAPR